MLGELAEIRLVEMERQEKKTNNQPPRLRELLAALQACSTLKQPTGLFLYARSSPEGGNLLS